MKEDIAQTHDAESTGRRLWRELPSAALQRARRAFAYASQHWVRTLVCVLTFLVLALLVDLTAACFLTFALVMLLMGLDSRISIVLFMLCLAACAVLLAMDRSERAGQVAVWSYYFLAIGVTCGLVDYGRGKWTEIRRARGEAAETRPESRAGSFLRDNFLSAVGYMIIATFAANFLNYLFNVTAGRLLGRDAYSEFAALLSIFMIITLPTTSLQAMLAKKITEFRMVDDEGSIHEITIRCLQISLIVAAAVALVFLVFNGLLASYLHISGATPVLICGLAMALAVLIPAFYGVFQGYQWFILLGSVFFAYSAGRFVLGWFFIKIGWGVSGALLGGALSSIFVLAISVFVTREILFRRKTAERIRLWEIAKSYMPFILSNGIFLLLVSIDAVIAKRKFSSDIAGDYACAAFLGKMILYFPSSVGVVIFPKLVEAHVARRDTRRLLWKGLLVVLAGSATLSAIFIAFPDFIITKLYGIEFIGAASILWMICLAMSVFTLVGMFIYYFLATEETRFLLMVLTVFTLGGIAAMYIAAATIFQIAMIEFITGTCMLAVFFFRLLRMDDGRGEPAVEEGPPAA